MAETMQKRTPLYDRHMALGARMMRFGGFEMPVQYTSIIDEHLAVRQAAGLFDVSHMGEIFVRGPRAFEFVQQLITNDASRLYDGRALYTVMCTPEGGVVDDLLVYRFDAETYLLVVNAANIEKDFAWMQEHNSMGAQLENRSDEIALLALQGPAAFTIARHFVPDLSPDNPRYYHFRVMEPGTFLGCRWAVLSHTGYTGEPGLEIYCYADEAANVWDALLEVGQAHGLKPAGLGARDTLRLEAGYCLYGNELDESTNPLEAGLSWVVKFDKGHFIGREALLRIKEAGPARRLIGLVLEARGIPRAGYPIVDATETPIGQVTSGSLSPVLQQGIALGYVPNQPAYTEPGQPLGVQIRRQILPAHVHKPPFVKLHKK
ncbi:glycine cleavage system aminomethyltransferase GcvT [Rhodothermus profundi]|uniref:Aminomethyltransferase n=1 Tax=Rhodothermus profundi TaxID=633813 RepID=A0A1M6WQY6_9BACT|nr:glycine cleavage system aminomethyltransferase GcvT [Rhodothermus profundi]SHK96180.1 aminomethyltransferase [Rhodothermus profundi]